MINVDKTMKLRNLISFKLIKNYIRNENNAV